MPNLRITPPAAAALALLLAGCGGDAGEPGDSGLSLDTTVAAAGPEGVAVSSDALEAANADQRFLQQMSDHHVGLLQMSRLAEEHAAADTVKTEARHFIAGHTNDLQQMQNMLQEGFGDSHQPTIMPRHAAMADSLTGLRGADFDRAYVRDVVEHHRGGLRMIDEYLPAAADENVKVMAQKMKAVQEGDVKRLEALLATL